MNELTLAELRGATRGLQIELLSLFGAAVACEHPSDFESLAVFTGDEKGVGDAETDRSGRSGEATAEDLGDDVILAIRGGRGQRPFEVLNEGDVRHVFGNLNAVDSDLSPNRGR